MKAGHCPGASNIEEATVKVDYNLKDSGSTAMLSLNVINYFRVAPLEMVGQPLTTGAM